MPKQQTKEYQIIARKYRPQTFGEVIGQSAIVATLKNAIKNQRLAQAYLFCGSRGTGKTTLARVLAKALNCQNPSDEHEPCNQCSSCKEITGGHSMDVLEIDGASHRGIEDIRQINETVAYASASGGYKIYIIDEVHMLTKEAFNALLKTLEEPPPKVKFFFATTEPHKVLPTILSRCQRFNLERIPLEKMLEKLTAISKDLGVEADEEALRIVATRANGGLRDAESLLDQIIAFHEGKITTDAVASILGVVSRESFFELDREGKKGNLAKAFEIAHQVFSGGKDLLHFIESLTEHFRDILMVKLSGEKAPFLVLSAAEREQYAASAKLYRKEQCLTILDYLVEMQEKIRHLPSKRIALEAILLRIIRSHNQMPIEYLVRRLTELESAVGQIPATPTPAVAPQVQEEPIQQPPPAKSEPAPQKESIQEDPTPALTDLPKPKPKPKAQPKPKPTPPPPVAPVQVSREQRTAHDTLLQFAAVELEGRIER